jgi:nicotinamide-nucleotide amidase
MSVADPDPTLETLAELMSRRLGGRQLACAESFTAGALCQALVSVEGSGNWFRGGLVSYQSNVKQELLGVRPGPVVEESAAREMAAGVARLLRADAAVATTGVAGPASQDGRPPGVVIIGWCVDGRTGAETLELPGDPRDIVSRGTRAALAFLSTALVEATDGSNWVPPA